MVAVLCTDDKIEALAGYLFLETDEIDVLICTNKDTEIQESFATTECTIIKTA